MRVHKGPPEEEKLVACSLLLLRRLEKKRVQESALASLGVALWEKRSCMYVPGLYPKDPPSLAPCWFHGRPPKPYGQRRSPPGSSGPSFPRLAPFWAKRRDIKLWKVKVSRLFTPSTLPRSLKGRPW